MGRALSRAAAPTSRPQPRRTLFGLIALGAIAVLAVLLVTGLPGGSGSSGQPATTTPGLWRPAPIGPPTMRLYVDRGSLGGPCDDTRPVSQARSPGTPWCSLERAVSTAPAGALVSVRGGAYGPLAINDYHSRRFLQLQAYPDENVSIAGIAIRRSDHLRIQGFRIDGRMDVTDHASDLQFADNRIKRQRSGMYFYGTVAPGSSVRRVLIDHNLIENIDYTGAQGVAEGYGIEMVGNIADFDITGNTIKSVAEDYLQLGSGSNVRVIGNRFLGPTLSLSHPQAHADLWQIFGGGDHIVFADNVVHDAGGSTGLLFQFSGPARPYRDVTIENNLFDRGSRGYEMQIYNTVGLRIVANTVVGSQWGTLLRDDPRVSPGSGYVVLNNIFDAQEGYAFSEERDWGTEDYNVIMLPGQAPGHFGPHDLFSAPRFVDRARGDLRLAPGSPGVDAGTSDGTPRTDLLGRPRVDDPATPNRGGGSSRDYDIGAYEYSGNP